MLFFLGPLFSHFPVFFQLLWFSRLSSTVFDGLTRAAYFSLRFLFFSSSRLSCGVSDIFQHLKHPETKYRSGVKSQSFFLVNSLLIVEALRYQQIVRGHRCFSWEVTFLIKLPALENREIRFTKVNNHKANKKKHVLNKNNRKLLENAGNPLKNTIHPYKRKKHIPKKTPKNKKKTKKTNNIRPVRCTALSAFSNRQRPEPSAEQQQDGATSLHRPAHGKATGLFEEGAGEKKTSEKN